jgi:hypothetical protein
VLLQLTLLVASGSIAADAAQGMHPNVSARDRNGPEDEDRPRSGEEQQRLLDIDHDYEREDVLTRRRLQDDRSAWWNSAREPLPEAESSPSLREDRRSSRPPNA